MNEWITYLEPLFLTILFECFFAFVIFKINNKRNLIIVLLANILTNPLLVYFSLILVYYLGIRIGRIITFTILEPIVIIVEYIVYKKCLLEKIDYLKMSIVLNVISIAGGLICQKIM